MRGGARNNEERDLDSSSILRFLALAVSAFLGCICILVAQHDVGE